MMKYWLILVLCLTGHNIWCGTRLSEEQFLIFTDSANLTFPELYTLEESGQISFKEYEGLSTDINYYWIKIDGKLLSGNQYLFLSNYFERIEAYYPGDTAPSAQSGRFIDFDQRTYSKGFYRNIIPLQDRSDPIYIRLTSITGFSLFNRSLSHLETATAEDLEKQSQQIFTSFTLLIGMEFIILLINIVLLILRPSFTAFFYNLLILTGILLANFQNQVTVDIIPIDALTLHYTEMILGMSIAYSFAAFSSYYLNGASVNKTIHYLMIVPYFPLILIFGFIGTGHYHPPAATIYFLFTQVVIIYILFKNWRQQKRRSSIFAIANFLPVFTAMALILALNGILEHSFLTTNAVYLGFMLRDSVFTIDLMRDYFKLQTESVRSEMQIEKLNEEKEQLKRIEELKTRFFNNVSHELRTPLTLVLSPLEKSLKNNNVPEELRKNLKLSLRNGKYLQQLVNEMLDLAKLDKGELHLVKTSVDVVELLYDIRDSFQNYANEKGQSLYIAAPRESIIALVDSDKLEKIMINLVSNAIKYSDKPGNVMIKIEEQNANLIISVSDEGIGVEAHELSRIFERYYQSDNTRKVEGTGIGLSIVKEFVMLHRGEVNCVSQIGKGSTFTITLPDAQQFVNMEELPTDTDHHFDNSKPLLLIVEDHRDMRSYLKDHFTGYFVEEATHGLEALEKLERGLLPDLILSDYMMPKLDGYEFARKVKQDERWANIPVMFLTARTLTEDKIKVLNLGVDDYIIKPFDLDELEVRIKNMLSTSKKWRKYLATNKAEMSFEQQSSFKLKLDQYILDKLANTSLSNADIADQFSLSERNLYRRVKSATGQSPASYMREIRLQKARLLLESQNEMTVGEIARTCGIDNLAYFSQAFKKRFGKSPSDLQSRHVVK